MCFWRFCKTLLIKCWPKKDSDDSFVSFNVDGVNIEVGNNENQVNAIADGNRAFRIRRALRSMISPQMNEAISDDEQMVLEVDEGASNDDEDRDRLFEEYISSGNQSSSQTRNYNTDLPTEHAYLGKLERVEGVDFLEPGQVYRIPICGHHSIVYPGEKIPLILSTSFLSEDHSDGIKIGLVFWDQSTENKFFGVTCQVYEKTLRNSSAILKTTAQQRFLLVKQSSGSYTSTYSRDGSFSFLKNRIGYYADVKILPEITLPDPLINACSNNQAKFSISTSIKQCNKFKNYIARTTVWPKFVYDQYGMVDVMQKVKRFLAFLKITAVPEDPVKLSFWLARNIPIISEEDRASIFYANSVIDRMLIINKSLDYMCYFCCKRCELKIGNYNEIFAMSKEGVQAAYCNPSGYVHETLTIYNTIPNSTYVVDRPSTEFSWFPGYSWQITLCNGCHCHLGWKFAATRKNYLPKLFYGLSGKSISVKSVKTKRKSTTESCDETNEDDDENDEADDDEDTRDDEVRVENYAEERI